MQTPEAAVKSAIKKEMTRRGWYWHMPVQAGYGSPTLDFLCCMPVVIQQKDVGQRVGTFIGLETKRPGVYKGTPRQESVIRSIQAAGGISFVAQSWDDVARVLGMDATQIDRS